MTERKKLVWYYWGAALLILLTAFLFWLLIFRLREYTDDAYVEGNQVIITPLQHGFITAIHTDDTFLVKKGDLLVELDRTDALIAFESAKQELGKVVRQVCQAYHDVFVTQADSEVKKAELVKAIQDFQHREAVLPEEGVSLEDYEHAVAALRAGYFSFKLAQTLYDKAIAFVQGSSVRNHPLVIAAADNVRNRWVQLFRCNIYSPVEGLAAQRTIQVGMWVKSGSPLMAVIPLDQIWVNANYKETQLKRMRIGQPVRITSDLYGRGVVYHGKIVGLPGGAGNAFSLLPPQNLSGNWIKIVQRLPVRVALDPQELKDHPLRIGLSMEAWTRTTHEGELVPTSSENSPCYDTPIFEGEEAGVCELIDCLFHENMDPTLSQYAQKPLLLERIECQELPEEISSLDISIEATNDLLEYILTNSL